MSVDQWMSNNAVLRERQLSLATATYAPRIPFDDFIGSVFRPVPGEHISIFGSTGKGKTALQNAVLPLFPFVTVFATKPQDVTMDRLIASRHYMKLAHWYRLSPTEVPRRVLWPDATRLRSKVHQRKVFEYALDAIFREAGRPKEKPIGWAVAIDEFWYLTHVLSMREDCRIFIVQGRSLGHTMIMATQRPFEVPQEMYSQATHVFLFREREKRNLDRLGEINNSDSRLVRAIVSNLEPFQVLYINTLTGEMARTRVFPYLANGPHY